MEDLDTRLDDSVFAPPKHLEASEACINDQSNYILVIQKCFVDEKEEELRTSEFLVSCAFYFVAYPDGRVEEVKLRHCNTSEGGTKILKTFR